MDIDRETCDGALLLSIRDARIDAAAAVGFKEQVRQFLQGHKGRLVIDMTNVEFLDSSGLGALVAVMKMLDGGRRLELAGCGLVVRKVLKLTRMDSVFILHESMAGATPSGRDAA